MSYTLFLTVACSMHLLSLCTGQDLVNVAEGKASSQSSVYPSFTPDKAVDKDERSCMHTGDNDYSPWWSVDLGRIYPIWDIRLQLRPNYIRRILNSSILADGHLCTKIVSDPTGIGLNIRCKYLTYGRFINITKDFSNVWNRYYLNFCDFKVLVPMDVITCNIGLTGQQCTLKCPVDCGGGQDKNVCHKLDGKCYGCIDGRAGYDCLQNCSSSNCLNNKCDQDSGACFDCHDNFLFPKCEECKAGFYGENCDTPCRSSLCLNNVCDRRTGQCAECQENFKAPDCSACDRGKYGEDCKYDCGSCADSQDCDKINGTCLKCVPGKKLPYCKSSCTNGTYGSDCVKVCHCKDGQPCNVITGECIDGCAPGWTSKTCDQNCETGKYGQDCLQECGHCAGNAVCKVTNGHCPSCTPGMNPPLCKDACKNGTYGGDCSKTCGHCKDGQPCNVITGECVDGCTAGWTSKTCDQSLVSFDVLIIAGAIIGGFLILAVSISVPLWLKWFKHRSVEENNRKQVQLQISSFNRKHLQAQADLPISLETGVDYDNMGNPYDSLDISVLDDDAKYTQPAFTQIKTSTVKDTAN